MDLRQGGKVVSVICAVCGSSGGRVVRRSLLSTCPGAPTPGRRLALRDVLLGFLPGSKRAVLLDLFLEEFSVPSRSLLHQGPSLPVLPSSLLAAISSRATIEPVLNLPSSTSVRGLFVRRRC